METNDAHTHSEDQARASIDMAAVMPAQTNYVTNAADEEAPCFTCGGKSTMPMSYVYALGQIEARFPRLAVEKEFFQVAGRAATNGKTDQQVLKEVLSNRANRYLARQMCWVFSIQGLETYMLQPRDPADLDLLVDSLRPGRHPGDIDLVVGVRGPIAPPDMCNGLRSLSAISKPTTSVSGVKCRHPQRGRGAGGSGAPSLAAPPPRRARKAAPGAAELRRNPCASPARRRGVGAGSGVEIGPLVAW